MKVIFFLFVSLFTFNVSAIEIKNFRVGAACTDTKTFGWVCHKSRDIYITGQSQCRWNGEDKPCTWYGFEFDYSNNKGTDIECKYINSFPGSEGNPKKVIKENTMSGTYSFKLEEEKGHFFNPQYSILSVQPLDKSVRTTRTVCTADGEVAFEFELIEHFPVADE